jgi:hypothetical protein
MSSAENLSVVAIGEFIRNAAILWNFLPATPNNVLKLRLLPNFIGNIRGKISNMNLWIQGLGGPLPFHEWNLPKVRLHAP